MPIPKDAAENVAKLMGAFLEIAWLMPLVAVAEIIGGTLFMTNRFRALGAIIIFPVLIGVLLTHLIYLPAALPVTFVLMAINIWVMVENREKYLPLIR